MPSFQFFLIIRAKNPIHSWFPKHGPGNQAYPTNYTSACAPRLQAYDPTPYNIRPSAISIWHTAIAGGEIVQPSARILTPNIKGTYRKAGNSTAKARTPSLMYWGLKVWTGSGPPQPVLQVHELALGLFLLTKAEWKHHPYMNFAVLDLGLKWKRVRMST